MTSTQQPSIISHLLGPFGDRLQQIDNILKSFHRLNSELKEIKQDCYEKKAFIDRVLTALEMDRSRLAKGQETLDNLIELITRRMDSCDECIQIVTDTEEFRQAREDYQNILAEVRKTS